MSSIDWATQFKIGMYLLNRKSVTNTLPRSTNIKQVLNELPTNKRLGPDLSGVPLIPQNKRP